MRMGFHPPRFMKGPRHLGVAEALAIPSKVDTIGSLNTLQGRQRPSVHPPAALPQIGPLPQPLSKQAFRPLTPPSETAFPATVLEQAPALPLKVDRVDSLSTRKRCQCLSVPPPAAPVQAATMPYAWRAQDRCHHASRRHPPDDDCRRRRGQTCPRRCTPG